MGTEKGMAHGTLRVVWRRDMRETWSKTMSKLPHPSSFLGRRTENRENRPPFFLPPTASAGSSAAAAPSMAGVSMAAASTVTVGAGAGASRIGAVAGAVGRVPEDVKDVNRVHVSDCKHQSA